MYRLNRLRRGFQRSKRTAMVCINEDGEEEAKFIEDVRMGSNRMEVSS